MWSVSPKKRNPPKERQCLPQQKKIKLQYEAGGSQDECNQSDEERINESAVDCDSVEILPTENVLTTEEKLDKAERLIRFRS